MECRDWAWGFSNVMAVDMAAEYGSRTHDNRESSDPGLDPPPFPRGVPPWTPCPRAIHSRSR